LLRNPGIKRAIPEGMTSLAKTDEEEKKCDGWLDKLEFTDYLSIHIRQNNEFIYGLINPFLYIG